MFLLKNVLSFHIVAELVKGVESIEALPMSYLFVTFTLYLALRTRYTILRFRSQQCAM